MDNGKKQKIALLTLFVFLSVVFWVTGIAKADTPIVTSFAVPANSVSLTVPITTFTATDGILVTGYYVSEQSFAPAVGDGAWMSEAPVAFTFASEGSKTLYAWVKDALGNISIGILASVLVDAGYSDAIAPAAASGLSVQ